MKGDDEFTGDLKKIMDDIAGGYIQFTKTAESGDVGVTRNTSLAVYQRLL